jgi:site-specific DNA-methyltransferase (adenine-specific)
MGKRWDSTGVAYDVTVWQECLRVLKPGGRLLAFGGTRTYHRLACAIEDAGFTITDQLQWLYGVGFPKSKKVSEGWGTALKPMHEPVCFAIKPLEGTYAANVLKWGCGAINIDGCRIGMRDANESGWSVSGSNASINRAMSGANYERPPKDEIGLGRWPGNVLLDDEAAAMLGEESRFFYRAKAARWERDFGLDGFEAKAVRPDGSKFGECTIWNGQNGDPDWRAKNPNNPSRNHHPTVKPVAVLRWLCRLVTPPGGTVLDPFMGSGSCGIAAKLEGFDYIGIELEAEYAKIAEARIAAWQVGSEQDKKTRPSEGPDKQATLPLEGD